MGFVAEGAGENVFVIRTARSTSRRSPPACAASPARRSSAWPPTSATKSSQADHPRDDIYIADEAFFTGTAAE